jgi:hypothetical protein
VPQARFVGAELLPPAESEYGGMEVSTVKSRKRPNAENARLERLLAEAMP